MYTAWPSAALQPTHALAPSSDCLVACAAGHAHVLASGASHALLAVRGSLVLAIPSTLLSAAPGTSRATPGPSLAAVRGSAVGGWLGQADAARGRATGLELAADLSSGVLRGRALFGDTRVQLIVYLTDGVYTALLVSVMLLPAC